MEVAGQWRREWAGTAEYGKVTEGGVTRRVARAMEVLHSSGPGSRVRVLRAAYHSTTGSGAPAASFLMHSSRRVISSGSNFLDAPTFMSKPLEITSKPFEISSTPLESSPDRFSESENYKVTEPDDSEISEPSKWRSASGAELRMPSEESSSTADNASIIDLDTRMNISKHTDLLRKYSFDSDSSEIQSKQSSKCRASPLFDSPPATLSTLKYKSLLNGSSDSWNDRRKSYSFEDTSPLSESIVHNNDTLAMESSTDSGICKSTEIVNENTDERVHHIHINKTDAMYQPREGTFKEWLAKNRHYKETVSKPIQENYIIEEPTEDKVSLQSTGKVSIALPMNNQVDDRFQYMKNHINGEIDRRTKRVEFCKTELHFAAESGKVNIIATDEKPPPTNDFRRRRSAFVPMKDTFSKPVTLFGDKLGDFTHTSEFDHDETNDVGDSDENTAATKSILKNKIPKPKPYLLGENMVFGQDLYPNNGSRVNSQKEFIIPTTVSMINKQLEPEEKRFEDLASFSDRKPEKEPDSLHSATVVNNNVSRTTNDGPLYDTADGENDYFQRFNSERNSFREDFRRFRNEVIQTNNTNSVKQKLRNLQTSPVRQASPKTRKLRESELTYFGVDSLNKKNREPTKPVENKRKSTNTQPSYNSIQLGPESDLQSVKLIQRVSSSACNSEAESDGTPEYQNLPLKANFAPVPLPRTRTAVTDYRTKRLDEDPSERVVIIKPVVEQSYQVCDTKVEQETRRNRRRQDISTTTTKSRSISEPPKYRYDDLLSKTSRDHKRGIDDTKEVVSSSQSRSSKQKQVTNGFPALKYLNEEDQLPEQEAVYVNLNVNKEKQGSIKPLKNHKKTPEYPSNRRSRKSSTERREKNLHTYGSENVQDQNKISSKSKTSRHTNSTDKQDDSKKIETGDTVKSQKSKDSLHKKRNRDEVVSSIKPNEVEPKNNDKSPLRDSKRHSTRTSQKHMLSGSLEKPSEVKYDSHGKRSNRVVDSISRDGKYDATITQKRDRSRSKDNNERQDKTKSSERHHHSHKSTRRGGIDGDASKKSDKHKQSEYVINYDDKNGTVSSICKVKPGVSKKIIVHPEKTKESKSKTKSPNDKTSLLQYKDQQWIHNESIHHGDKKWKGKVHIQRNCQLL